MAYGDFSGGILPFPGATQRDALLDLLSTRGLSTDITMPFYNQFMAERSAARESRQDYLTQMLATMLGSATAGQSGQQAGMVSDALAQAYGVKAGTPLEEKVAGITSSLYPERRNPLKEMPGGLSPLAEAPVSYEDMLALNQSVKEGVAQGKTLEQIKQEATARVQQLFKNPNYVAPAAGAEALAVSDEPQYIMPENWAAIQGQMNTIIERAYEQFAGQPGIAPPATQTAAAPAAGTGSSTGVGDLLKMLTGLGAVAGTGFLGLKAAQRFLPYKYPSAPAGGAAPAAPAATAAAPAARTVTQNPAAMAGKARMYPSPTGTSYTGPKPVTRYYPSEAEMRTSALGNLPTRPPVGLPAQQVLNRLGYTPQQARGSLIGMIPLGISEFAGRAAFGGDELSQTAMVDQLREDSVPLPPGVDASSLPSSLREQVWQDSSGQWFVYLPVGEM